MSRRKQMDSGKYILFFNSGRQPRLFHGYRRGDSLISGGVSRRIHVSGPFQEGIQEDFALMRGFMRFCDFMEGSPVGQVRDIAERAAAAEIAALGSFRQVGDILAPAPGILSKYGFKHLLPVGQISSAFQYMKNTFDKGVFRKLKKKACGFLNNFGVIRKRSGLLLTILSGTIQFFKY